jgi:hypothetical protein
MATFPAMVPSARTYTPPTYPHTPHRAMDGRRRVVSHGTAALGGALSLGFAASTPAELADVEAHYLGQYGGFLSFDLPAEITADVDESLTAYTLAGYSWRYVGPPAVVDISIDDPGGPTMVHDITVALELVPPESAFAAGARLLATPTLTTGSAGSPVGATLTTTPVLTTGSAGSPTGAALTTTPTLTTGAATGS